MVDSRDSRGFGHGRVNLIGQVVLSHNSSDKEDILVGGIVPNLVVGVLLGSGHVLHFIKSNFLVFPQFETGLVAEIVVGELEDEILTDKTQRNDVFDFGLQLSYDDLVFTSVKQLPLDQADLFLEVDILLLFPVELLEKGASLEDGFHFNHLQPVLAVDLSPLGRIPRADYPGIGDPRLQKFQKANCRPHIDVFDCEGTQF